MIPVIEGLFTLEPKEPRLIGSKCTSCGTFYFPETITCSNPDCREKKVEKTLLSRRGKLYSYTVQYYPPPAPFKYEEPFKPYGIGLIELPEKVMVLGMLTESDPEKLKVGIEVEMVLEKMYQEKGQDAVTWKFKPV